MTRPRPSPLVIFVLEAAFTISGVVSTLVGQVMVYHGAAGVSGLSMGTTLLQYLGMILLFLIPEGMQTLGLGRPAAATGADRTRGHELKKDKTKTKMKVKMGMEMEMDEQLHHREHENDSDGDGSGLDADTPAIATNAKLKPNPKSIPISRRRWVGLAAMEWLGGVLCALGVFFAGSGIYQVVYATVVIFTALLARVVLGKKLNWMQWASIGVVTLGLALSTKGRPGSHSSIPKAPDMDTGVVDLAAAEAVLRDATAAAEAKADILGSHVLIGIMITLAAAITYSIAYVTTEGMIEHMKVAGRRSTNKNRGIFRGFGFIGVMATGFTLLYIIFGVIPNWETEMAASVAAVDGRWSVIIPCAVIVTISCSTHTYTYILLLDYVGSTAAGVMQGMRAVLVFAISGVAFCGHHEEQCFTMWKGAASLLIICGVMAFRALGEKKE